MRFRSCSPPGGARRRRCACAAPARAVETGVNETLGQTVPTADEGAAARRRLGAGVGARGRTSSRRPGTYTEHLVAELERKVAALKARGIKVLVVVHRAPAWASGGRGGDRAAGRPGDVRARSCATLAQRVPGRRRVGAVERAGQRRSSAPARPTRRAYAALLQAAYPAIKSVAAGRRRGAPAALVGNDIDFVARALRPRRAGLVRRGRRAHRHGLPRRRPGRYYRDERGRIGRYTFSAYREVHAVMSRPRRRRQADLDDRDRLEHAVDRAAARATSARGRARSRSASRRQRQARFLRAAYRCLAADPFVGVGVLVRACRTSAARGTRGGYGLYRRNGKAKRGGEGVPAAASAGSRPRAAAAAASTARRRRSACASRATARASPASSPCACARPTTAAAPGCSGSTSPPTAQHVRTWGGIGGSIDPVVGDARSGSPARTRSRSACATTRTTRRRSPSRSTRSRGAEARSGGALPIDQGAMRTRLPPRSCSPCRRLLARRRPRRTPSRPASTRRSAQTVPTAQTAPELGADWVRAVGAVGGRASSGPGVYTEHLLADLERGSPAPRRGG